MTKYNWKARGTSVPWLQFFISKYSNKVIFLEVILEVQNFPILQPKMIIVT